jgi:hypothetical protein
VADRALDGREAQPKCALHLIHLVVHVGDLERRIDEAMKIDDLAVAGRSKKTNADLLGLRRGASAAPL